VQPIKPGGYMFIKRPISRHSRARALRRSVVALSALVVAFASPPAALAASDYESTVLTDQPSGYWRLGDPAGSATALDSTGGNDGQYRNVSPGTAGALSSDTDTAANFASTNDTPNNDDVFVDACFCPFGGYGTGILTAEAWVRTDVSDNGVVMAESDGSNPIWAVSIDSGSVRFDFTPTDPEARFTASGSGFVSDGVWHHLVVVAQRGVDAHIYVDNVLTVTPWTISGNGTGITLPPIISPPSSATPVGPDTWGFSVGDAAGAPQFNGDIDEAAIYTHILPADRVFDHFVTGSGDYTEADDGGVYNFTTSDLGDEITDPVDGTSYTQDFMGEDSNAEDATCCGPDNSRQIQTTTKFPYRAVVWIKYVNQSGLIGWCSGYMIGANTVATAGHCVYDPQEFGGWISRSFFVVVPGANADAQDPTPYGSCGATRLFASRGWRVSRGSNSNYDYGAIKLNCSIGNRTGYFGLTRPTSPVGITSIISGYPSGHPIGTMWRSVDQVRAVTTKRIFYRNDTFPGDSGAPVYRSSTSACRWCAFGIHTTGNDVVNGQVYNGGTRITLSVLRNLNHWRHL
jgi:glutamyl endopeptidase